MKRTWLSVCWLGLATAAFAQSENRWTYALFMLRDGSFDYRCAAVAVEQRGPQTLLLTAAHCFSPGQIYAIAADPRDREGWAVIAEIYGISADADLALFVVEASLRVAPLGHDPSGDERVAMAGWPWGEELTSYLGHIVPPFAFGLGSDILVYLTPYIVPGLSGSPIYCVSQEAVCGILTSGYEGMPHFAGIVPISAYRGRWLVRQTGD